MPDLYWLYDPGVEDLIRKQTLSIVSIYAHGVFQSPWETQAAADRISEFLYDRLLDVRDSNSRKEMTKPAYDRRTMNDAVISIDKFVSLVFREPDVRRGAVPQLHDIADVYQVNFCGFWPFC